MIKRKSPPESRIETQIITGMIHSTEFLKEIYPIYREHSLKLSYAKIIADWCLEYFKQYKEAPGKQLNDIYITHIEDNNYDLATLKLIETFLLTTLDKKPKKKKDYNVKYIADKAEKHFRLQAVQCMKDKLDSDILNGRIDEAEEGIKEYNRVTRPKTVGINLITSRQAIIAAFDNRDEDVLFKLQGDLGKTVGNFERESLIGIVAPTKVGKTWQLQEVGFRALFSGLKVLFFSFEMSANQMTTRIHMNIHASPTEDCKVVIPVFDCKLNQTNNCRNEERTCNIGIDSDFLRPPVGRYTKDIKSRYDVPPKDYNPCTHCRGTKKYKMVTWFKIKAKTGLKKQKMFAKQKALIAASRMKGDSYRFLRFPSKSVSMREIRTTIHNLEYYEDFIPDVIITDYADKIKPENQNLSELAGEVEVWEQHKALAQERHCLVVTANQSNTVRSGKNVGKGDWAGSIHKQDAVDKSFAINQTPEEKEKGIVRMTVLAERNEGHSTIREIVVLQCLAIGKPYLDSYLL